MFNAILSQDLEHEYVGRTFIYEGDRYKITRWFLNGRGRAIQINPDGSPVNFIEKCFTDGQIHKVETNTPQPNLIPKQTTIPDYSGWSISKLKAELDRIDKLIATHPDNNKGYTFMRDVITKYHPRFLASEDLCNFGLDHPEDFNIEHLVEQCIANVGNLTFEDAAGYDFVEDKSDSKTASINKITRKIEVGSVENKIGALRLTIYNPFTLRIDYFFIPKIDADNLKRDCFGNSSHKKRLSFTYNIDKDYYNSFEKYRTIDFPTMAKTR